jgi:hypothetical protein
MYIHTYLYNPWLFFSVQVKINQMVELHFLRLFLERAWSQTIIFLFPWIYCIWHIFTITFFRSIFYKVSLCFYKEHKLFIFLNTSTNFKKKKLKIISHLAYRQFSSHTGAWVFGQKCWKFIFSTLWANANFRKSKNNPVSGFSYSAYANKYFMSRWPTYYTY